MLDVKAAAAVEESLGLPTDPDKLRAYYDHQRMLYKPWNTRTFCPSWTLAEGKCRNCEAETLVVRAGNMDVCLMWCLNTGLQQYPTGDQHPTPKDFLRHAKDCQKTDASTLHSWSLTSKYSEALKTAFMFSNPQDGKKTSSSTSSRPARSNPSKKSSSVSPSPNSALPVLRLQGSNTQTK